MIVYLAFIAGLAVGFLCHCAWRALQTDPGSASAQNMAALTEIWPRDARLALLRNDHDEHEELTL